GTDVAPSVIIAMGDLAESWQQADDTTWIFKLRSGVKWQNIAPVNGRDLLAEDVVYSFNRQNPEQINSSRLDGIPKFEAPDKSTVKLTLARPNADLLASLSACQNKVVPREVVEQKGDLKEGPLIGTGPWILEKWDPADGRATLRKNPDYF